MECQFCGSLACEWDSSGNGATQLGCTDCGYDRWEWLSEAPFSGSWGTNPLIDSEMWALTNSAMEGLFKARRQAEAWVFHLVCRTAPR